MKKFLAKFFDITFWKFIIVGVINTLFGMGLSFLLFNLFNVNEWISTVADYFFGSILSYFLNKHFTFNSKDNSKETVFSFVINIVVCYGLAYGIAKVISVVFLSSLTEKLQGNIFMLMGKVLFVGFNYIGQRFFVFTKENKE